MTSPNPVAGGSTGNTSTSSTQSTSNNTLGPDSFITLLTAQLQAQDPLSPMDPDQMVNELTSINTLQQIIQIRSDTDALAGALASSQGGSSSSSTNGSTSPSSSIQQAAAQQNTNTNSISQFN
jgi:flagellar basal-body rod modification protein FlgD